MTKRTKSYGLNNPLQDVFPIPVRAQRAPTAADAKSYEVGQIWVDQNTSKFYGLASVSGGSATWSLLTNSASNEFPITPYVVGTTGQAGYQTIQSAIDAANAAGGGVVFIQPGIFSENLTLYDKVSLFGSSESDTFIIGSHTPPTSGTVNIFRVSMTHATSVFSSAAAGSATILIEDSTLGVGNGYTFDLPNWTGSIATYDIGPGGADDGVINNTGGATCFFISGTLGGGSGNTMITSGSVTMQEIDLVCPYDAQTGSNLSIDYTVFFAPVTFSNNAIGEISFSRFSTGALTSVNMNSSANISIYNSIIDSSNVPAIAGTGVGFLNLSGVEFLNDSTIAGTFTLEGGNTVTGLLTLPVDQGHVQVKGGAVTDFIGQATLVSGIVTVANTSISANDKILVTRDGTGTLGALGVLDVTINPATSFTITARVPGTGSIETNDTSLINYFIVRQI